jgi:hypothetical protein
MSRCTTYHNDPARTGICGTPVIDEAAGRIHVLSLQRVDNGQPPGPGDVGEYHVHVMDVNTGAVLSSHKLFDPGAPGRPTFDGNAPDQRGALNLMHGWVYATFADFLAFDAGPYHGWLVGWEANNPARQHFFPTTRSVGGGGAWGARECSLPGDGIQLLRAVSGSSAAPGGTSDDQVQGFQCRGGAGSSRGRRGRDTWERVLRPAASCARLRRRLHGNYQMDA